jgi:cytochrome P450
MAMAWASGNRDEAVIADPDVFRIDRQPNKHITYGVGAHVCLGQHLARLEMRILFEELFERLDSVELAGEPKVLKSLIVSGLKSLPIRFHAR